MDERKSMGTALVDVFDAGLTLVKAEVNNVGRKVGEVAKAKGVGAVVLLAATGPLILGLIFLILALFYLLMVWLPAWGAALIIALLSFAVTGGLIMFGLKKLSAEVRVDEPLVHRDELAWANPARTDAGVSPTSGTGATVSTTTYSPRPDTSVKPATTTYAAGTTITGNWVDDLERATRDTQPGVPVSTRPTYQDDMRRGGRHE